jgi:hypothetical protein
MEKSLGELNIPKYKEKLTTNKKKTSSDKKERTKFLDKLVSKKFIKHYFTSK